MSAPNLKELDWAISELESQESSESRYMLLAALYTCRNEMLGLTALQPQPQIAAYSETAGPIEERVGRYGNSDFLKAVADKDPAKIWAILDDFVGSLSLVNRRAYDHLVERLENAQSPAQ